MIVQQNEFEVRAHALCAQDLADIAERKSDEPPVPALVAIDTSANNQKVLFAPVDHDGYFVGREELSPQTFFQLISNVMPCLQIIYVGTLASYDGVPQGLLVSEEPFPKQMSEQMQEAYRRSAFTFLKSTARESDPPVSLILRRGNLHRHE